MVFLGIPWAIHRSLRLVFWGGSHSWKHVGGNDPWIGIRRSGQEPQKDPDEDWAIILGIVILIVFIAWLLS